MIKFTSVFVSKLPIFAPWFILTNNDKQINPNNMLPLKLKETHSWMIILNQQRKNIYQSGTEIKYNLNFKLLGTTEKNMIWK
jgi:hypothetical protein